jgi:hypothetical protein
LIANLSGEWDSTTEYGKYSITTITPVSAKLNLKMPSVRQIKLKATKKGASRNG